MSEERADTVPVADLRDEQRRRWREGRPVRAEDLLARHPRFLEDPDAALEVVYHEVVLRGEAGENPQLPEYLARFPALADRLGPLFEVHRAFEGGTLAAGLTAIGPVAADSSDTLTPAAADAPRGYELHDRIGLGGMGAVYRARDTTLDRDVAVKLLRHRFSA